MRRFGIGDVGFTRDGKYISFFGDDRVAMLTRAFCQQDLGPYKLAYIGWDGSLRGEIGHGQVEWHDDYYHWEQNGVPPIPGEGV